MMAGDNFQDIAHLLGAAQGELSAMGETPPMDSTSQASLNITSTSHRFELKSGLNYFTFLNSEERALDRYLFSLLQGVRVRSAPPRMVHFRDVYC